MRPSRSWRGPIDGVGPHEQLSLGFNRLQLHRIAGRPFAPAKECQCCYGSEHSNRAYPLQHRSTIGPCSQCPQWVVSGRRAWRVTKARISGVTSKSRLTATGQIQTRGRGAQPSAMAGTSSVREGARPGRSRISR
jgi:hypothetical protein